MKRKTWVALPALALAIPVLAQQTRPDAGTILETQRPQAPAPVQPSGAAVVVVPPAPPAAAFDRSIRVTPTGFRIEGNTLFPVAVLQAEVAQFVGKPTDMEGLLQAATAIRRYYRERGYLLTEAYLPRQQFPAGGGVVTIQVLEARVGKVNVRVEGEGVSETLAGRIVRSNLHSGDYISEQSLDRPVLLLRDLAGFDATASVEPGANVGEADVTVIVKPYGPKVEGLFGLDNFGVRAAGAIRAYAQGNVNNLLGQGDQVTVRAQTAERNDTNLYRLGYSIPVGPWATKLGVSATKSEYALGKQFAGLGASGEAKVYDLSITQPFIRTRTHNLLGALTFERKDLEDQTTNPPSLEEKRVNGVRLSVLGNVVDSLFFESFNSFTLSVFRGDLKLDPATLALDQGPTGFRTAGGFTKVNLDYLRTTYVSAKGRVTLGLQAQKASKNLTSAEKMPLGGPNAVRGYPVGEAVGDSGAVIQLEYQHQLPSFGLNVPLSASVFYDWGHIKYNESVVPTGVTATSDTLQSLGVGLTVGTFGKYLLVTQLAWRTGSYRPSIAPDKQPRLWFSLQKWL